MIAINFWFNVGQRSWTTGRIFKQDLRAGYSGTGRLNFKWSERGIHCCFLLEFVFGFSKMPVD
jgi:hypothetical protein